MKDLILHIGLSKSGSSTLQRQVFQHELGYLGTAPGTDLESNYAKQLQACAALGGRQFMDRKSLSAWSERVRSLADERWPAIHRLILSNETLSGANLIDDRPVIRLVSSLRNQYWNQGRIKILLVLRNQAERLASSYAQSSSRLLDPGQADFERYVQKHLDNRRYRRLLDYSEWFDSIQRAVGQENTCVLLLEDANEISFWRKLAAFCEIENASSEEMLAKSREKKNERRASLSERRWKISDLDIELLANEKIRIWMNAVSPRSFPSLWYKKLQSTSTARLESRYQRLHDRLIVCKGRETDFYLSSRVMDMVQSCCSEFNERLSEKMRRNLSTLGY